MHYKKEHLVYLSIVFGITFCVFIVFTLLGFDYSVFVPYSMALPALGAVVTTIIFKGNFSYIRHYLRFNKWIIIGCLIVIAVFILCIVCQIVLYPYVFDQYETAKMPDISVFIIQLLIGVTLGGLTAFLEEIGWRGFLQSRLIFKSALRHYLLIGLCWSAFHYPQIISGLMYKGQLIAGLVIHTCLLMSFSVLLSYLRDKSSSLIPPSIAHGVFNALIFTQSANIFSHTSHVVEGALWALFFALIAVFISLKLIRAGHMENLK